MSLGRWFRDYVYIPLGGSRRGTARACRNLMVTLLLGGLWHGANWTFVLWGGYHGLLLGGEVGLARSRALGALPRSVKRALAFLLVMLGWALFRSATVARAGVLYAGLLGARGWGELPEAMHALEFLVALPVCAAIVWCGRNLWHWHGSPTWRTALWVVPLLLASLYQVLTSAYSPFLYFQF
jgi:alginate O-acetyltransferase complex protein AlgI